MTIEQIDHCCDLFEQRLKAGEDLSAEQFLQGQQLPPDAQLLAELQKLERDYRQGHAPTASNPVASPVDLNCPTRSASLEAVGTVIGSYKLLQKLGEGGMGVVYMADQTKPVSRRVALKIIKPGMDSREVIARFEAERQALAMMDHPNIAKVFDAGMTGGGGVRSQESGVRGHETGSSLTPDSWLLTPSSGRPYFVMELVKGIPITRFCDERHLTPRERLELFVPICQAVQHAHQKGIIHRDLKPSNILVALYDDRPVPKIIDFGVAKAISQRLTEKTMFTQYGQIVGTIDYMSPEQASFNQLDVDTRSDIYSLGVLLYELLTGETPFDRKRLHTAAFDELLRIIQHEEPPRPSMRLSSNTALPTIAANRQTEPRKLSLLVRGELDWIVMKALEKDRARRYETANGLAMDVQRYLADEPVVACPPSFTYRLRKLARRHKAAFATAAAIAVVLVLGIIGTTWQAIRATLAERDLTTQRDRARTKETEAVANLGRATKAERELKEQLRQSYFDQAQARRWSGRPGRRFESLEALRKAAAIRPSMELRNEAIACLALFDLRVSREWAGIPSDLDKTSSIFVSPDLQMYSVSDASGNITVRRVAEDSEIVRLPSLGVPAWTQQFSPDGRFLAVNAYLQGQWSGNTTTALWRLADGEQVLKLAKRMNCRALDFTPDSRVVAIGEQSGTIGMYSTEDGTEVGRIALGFLPWVIRFDPQGRRIAITGNSDRRAEVREVESGAVTSVLPRELFAPERGPDDVAWHPEGDLLAVSSGAYFAIWNTADGRLQHRIEGHTGTVTDHLEFNRRGDRLVTTAWRGDMAFWDVSSGEQLVRVPAWLQHGWGERFQFSLDDNLLAYDLAPPNVRMWEVADGRECLQLYGTGGTGVAFHPNGRIVAVTQYDGLRLWDIATSRSLAYVPLPQCQSPVFHPHGDALILSHSKGSERWPFKLISTADGEHWQIGPPETLVGGPCFGVSLNADGSKVAVAKYDGIGFVIDWHDPAHRQSLGSHPGMMHAALSPDGQWVATGTWKGKEVRIWNAETGALERDLPGDLDSTVPLFTPDGEYLVTSEDEICLWKVPNWMLARSIDSPAVGNVCAAIAVSPDSRLLAVGANGQLKLYDLARWEELATLVAPDQRVFEFMSFSPDGSRIAVSAFGALQVWDLRAIRAGLAEMGLDWDLPSYGPAPEWDATRPIRVDVVSAPADTHRRAPEFQALNRSSIDQLQERDLVAFIQELRDFSGTSEQLVATVLQRLDAADAAVDLKSLLARGEFREVVERNGSRPLFDEWLARAPTLQQPPPGAILDNGRRDGSDDEEWSFSWSPVEGANGYRLFVKGATARFPVVDVVINETQYRHTSRAWTGHLNGWTWKVRARVRGEWGPWSEARTFNVEPPDTDPRPSPAPRVQSVPPQSSPLPPRISPAELVRNLAGVTQTPLLFMSARSGNFEIHLADPGTGELTNLSQHPQIDGAPAWSSDGTQIVFESNRNGVANGNVELYVMNADGSGQRPLTTSPKPDREPTWSPDDKRICFRRDTNDPATGSDLFVINADGTGEMNITNHPAFDGSPAWSPDGERIAFVSGRDDNKRCLYTMRPDGSDVRLLTRKSEGGHGHPAWSPDGRWIAFTGTVNEDQFEIFVIDADGQDETQLTQLGGLSTFAAWSPDGERIAFVHRPSGSTSAMGSLYVMRADGSDVQEIAPGECPVVVGRPAWKP